MCIKRAVAFQISASTPYSLLPQPTLTLKYVSTSQTVLPGQCVPHVNEIVEKTSYLGLAGILGDTEHPYGFIPQISRWDQRWSEVKRRWCITHLALQHLNLSSHTITRLVKLHHGNHSLLFTCRLQRSSHYPSRQACQNDIAFITRRQCVKSQANTHVRRISPGQENCNSPV